MSSRITRARPTAVCSWWRPAHCFSSPRHPMTCPTGRSGPTASPRTAARRGVQRRLPRVSSGRPRRASRGVLGHGSAASARAFAAHGLGLAASHLLHCSPLRARARAGRRLRRRRPPPGPRPPPRAGAWRLDPRPAQVIAGVARGGAPHPPARLRAGGGGVGAPPADHPDSDGHDPPAARDTSVRYQPSHRPP